MKQIKEPIMIKREIELETPIRTLLDGGGGDGSVERKSENDIGLASRCNMCKV